MRWEAFEAAAPPLAGLGTELFGRTGLCMVGTLRKDGAPRISPCEVYVVDGELLLGMMWRSKKALDLLRDPRLAVTSTQCDREGTTGDLKLYGRAVDVTDTEVRTHYADTLEATINWRPTEPFHLFSVDIESAGFISFGDQRRALRWDPGSGLIELDHPDG